MARRNILLHPGFIYIKRVNHQPRAGARRIKVVLAHGHTLYREGLRRLLDSQSDMQVVGQAADGLEAAERCRLLTPDVLVMDISLPPTGLRGLRLRLNHTPRPRRLVLAISANGEEVREAVREGADGILGDCDSAELARSIRALHRGEGFFSPEVASLTASESGPPRVQERPSISLTAREEDIFRLITQGMSNRQIAEALSLSHKTVRNRLFMLFRKLQVSNRTEAALYALREGLVYLDRLASPASAGGGQAGPTSCTEAGSPALESRQSQEDRK
ncbi:MAG: response regulator transcription factor [Dehalococcoidia bacterium]